LNFSLVALVITDSMQRLRVWVLWIKVHTTGKVCSQLDALSL